MFAKLVSWVKAAVLQAVVAEIVEDFGSAGHVIEVPATLLLEHEAPAKRSRKKS